MAITKNETIRGTTSCPSQGNIEKLSATSECDGSTDCSAVAICRDSIRELAYSLWEKAGHPEGDGV